MTRIHLLLTQLLCSALAVLLPASAAWANWGESWGSMVWSAAPPVVPGLGALGLALLALGLAGAAAWQLRRRAFAMSVLLVVLAIPLAAAAGSVSGLNSFSNGDAADANEVNHNFGLIEDAVNDNHTRVTAALSQVSTAQWTADTATTHASTAQATADAAQVRVAGSCAAGSSIRAIAADGTVTCEADTDTNTQLTNAEVAAAATAEGFVIGAHTVDTTLDEAAVDAFVDNNGYATATDQGPHERPGISNTAVGSSALENISTCTGWDCSPFGFDEASGNTAIGAAALMLNTEGDDNTATGHEALGSNTTGNINTAIGSRALTSNTEGSWNTASGPQSLVSNTDGSFNTASGSRALWSNSTGDRNIALGYRAGYDTTGTDNILIGHEGVAAENGIIRIGTSGTHTQTYIAGQLTPSGCINGDFCSDARLKVEIAPLDKPVLEEVLQIEAATYQWKDDQDRGTQIGLIAQEVEKVFPEVVSTSADGGQKGLSCTGLSAVTIRAIQELKAQKDAEIAALKAEQERQLAAIKTDQQRALAAIRGEMELRLARLESHDALRLASNRAAGAIQR